MGLIRKSLHIATAGAVAPNSKKQRVAKQQLAALQGKSEAEVRRAGGRYEHSIGAMRAKSRARYDVNGPREVRGSQDVHPRTGTHLEQPDPPRLRVNALIDDGDPCLYHQLLYGAGVLTCRLCGTEWDEEGRALAELRWVRPARGFVPGFAPEQGRSLEAPEETGRKVMEAFQLADRYIEANTEEERAAILAEAGEATDAVRVLLDRSREFAVTPLTRDELQHLMLSRAAAEDSMGPESSYWPLRLALVRRDREAEPGAS